MIVLRAKLDGTGGESAESFVEVLSEDGQRVIRYEGAMRFTGITSRPSEQRDLDYAADLADLQEKHDLI